MMEYWAHKRETKSGQIVWQTLREHLRGAARRAGALQRGLRWLDGVAGGLFIAFGVKLALTEAPR